MALEARRIWGIGMWVRGMGLLRRGGTGRECTPRRDRPATAGGAGLRWAGLALTAWLLVVGGGAGADPLDDLLAQAPAAVAQGPMLFTFADYDALDPFRHEDPDTLSEVVRRHMMPFTEAGGHPALDLIEAWPDRVGFAFADIGAALWTGRPSRGLLLLRGQPALTDAAAIGAVLDRNGWTHKTIADAPVWVRRPDGAQALDERDPDDLFDGGTGRSGRVAIVGEVLAFSPVLEPVQAVLALTADTPTLGSVEPLASSVAALRDPRDGPVTMLAMMALHPAASRDPFAEPPAADATPLAAPDLAPDLPVPDPARSEGGSDDDPDGAAAAGAPSDASSDAPSEPVPDAGPEPSVEVPSAALLAVVAEIRTLIGTHQCRIATVHGDEPSAAAALAVAQSTADWAVLLPPEPAEGAPVEAQPAAEVAEGSAPEGTVWRVVAAIAAEEDCWWRWTGQILRGGLPLVERPL